MGNALLDQSNAFDSFDGAADIVLVACGTGENKRVKDDVLDSDAVFFRQQVAGALGDFELPLAREGLRLYRILVNAADNDGGAIGPGQRANTLEFLFTVLEIDRVEDTFALTIGNRVF